MKTIAVIQARMGSKRLPGKTLMYLSKFNLLDTVINSVKRNKFIDDIIVVTSTNSEDDQIKSHCENNNISFFRGDSENVLSRYIQVAKKYNPSDTIVRVTADNPLNNSNASLSLYKKHNEHKNDYTCVEGLSHVVYEFIKVDALLKLSQASDLTYEDCEHVTVYFRRNKSKFKITSIEPRELGLKPIYDKLLTVDSIDDYNRLKKMMLTINIDEPTDFDKVYSWLSNN